jgi:hypothetical protein
MTAAGEPPALSSGSLCWKRPRPMSVLGFGVVDLSAGAPPALWPMVRQPDGGAWFWRRQRIKQES